MLDSGCDWGVKKDLFTPQRQLLRDQCCSINCASLYRVNVMKKDSIYSPNCKNKFSFVNTKPSLNQNEVETSHRLYTHKKIMNKKAERREKSPRTELRLWLGGEKRFILPPKAAFCCSHMINIAVSIVQVITVRPRAWQKVSLIQDAVDRHQTHQTYNKKERSQLNLELNHLALYRGLVWGETK